MLYFTLFKRLNFFLIYLTRIGGIKLEIKKQYIDGVWLTSTSNETRNIINPFNQEVIARVTESTIKDAELAIKAARKAFEHGDWPRTSATERGKVVRKIADLIER